jgi:hypothetical protein
MIFGAVLVTLGLPVAQAAAPVGPAFERAVYRDAQDLNGVAIADLNADGAADVIVTAYDGRAKVLFGSRQGRLRRGPVYMTAPAATSVAVGDVNRDGHQDFAVGNQSKSSADLFLGIGDEGFRRSTIQTGTWPRDVTLRDVDHDDVLDLLAATARGANVSVLLGVGDGSFEPRPSIDGSGTTALAAADFNGDGHEDLATTTPGALNGTGGSVSILLGRGDGSFRLEQTARVGLNPLDIAAADINGDGNADLVTANNESPNSLTVLLGRGNGSFRFDRHLRVAPHDNASALALGDIDSSGGLDIVTAASFLTSGPGSTFASAVAYNSVQGEGVAVADINGDGGIDIVATEWSGRENNYQGGGAVRVFLGRGSARLCIVPRVVRRTRRSATRLLRASGCALGMVHFFAHEHASQRERGRVIEQSLPRGTRAVFRTPISLLVEGRNGR